MIPMQPGAGSEMRLEAAVDAVICEARPMSWKDMHGPHGRVRAHYHHGNLREALIEAALSLIAANGPLGFTFAEAARQAGVSPAAPYRHFRDRDDLLADIAR